MSYAVIRLQGKQYLVSPGQELVVDRLPGQVKDKQEFKEVLLKFDGKNIKIGRPLVAAAGVSAAIVAHFKDKKIRVAKFKAKSRYRKVKGHRQAKTRLKIVKI